MKSKDMVYVVLKLFVILLIAEGIDYLGFGIVYWSAYLIQKAASIDAESTPVMVTQASFLLKFISAAFLYGMAHFIWIFTPKIVKYIFPSDNEIQEEKNWGIKAKNLQTAAFIVVGMVVFSRAILKLFKWIEDLLLTIKRTQMNNGMDINEITTQFFDGAFFLKITGILIYLVIGIALIVWGKQFSKFISKRNPGAVSLVQRLRLLRKAKIPGKRDAEEIQAG